MKEQIKRLGAYAVTGLIGMMIVAVFIWAFAQAMNAGQQVLGILIWIFGLGVPVGAFELGREIGRDEHVKGKE